MSERDLNDIYRRLDHLEKAEPSVIRSELAHVVDDVKEIKEDMKGLRRALWGAAASFTAVAVTIALATQGAIN